MEQLEIHSKVRKYACDKSLLTANGSMHSHILFGGLT